MARAGPIRHAADQLPAAGGASICDARRARGAADADRVPCGPGAVEGYSVDHRIARADFARCGGIVVGGRPAAEVE